MAHCIQCGSTLHEGSRFCSSCGAPVPAAVGEPSDVTAGPAAAGAPTAAAAPQTRPAASLDRTVVERFLEADWRSAAIAALLAVGILVIGAAVAAAGLWQSDDAVDLLGQGDLRDADAGPHNAAATTAAQAFRARLELGGDLSTGLMPLTLTIATLAALYAATRWTTRVDRAPRDRALHGARAGLVFALCVWLLSLLGDWQRGGAEANTSSTRTLVFALLFGLATALAAALWRTDGRDLGRDRAEVWRRWVQWRLPTEGALVALATGLLIGGIAAVVIAFLEKDTLGTSNQQLTSLLPYGIAVLVNLGVAAMHAGMLGHLLLPAPGNDADRQAAISLYERHGASPAYLLLLLLPVIALLAGAWWIRHRGRGLDDRGLQRAAYRMALPLTVLWVVLLFCSRIYYADNGGADADSVHVGPRVIEGVALMVLWGILGGWIAMALVRRVGRGRRTRPAAAPAAAGPPPPPAEVHDNDTLQLGVEERSAADAPPTEPAAAEPPATAGPADGTAKIEFEKE